MRITIYAMLLCLIYARSPLAQTATDLMKYETILDDFAKASANNLNFQNGINIFIENGLS